MVTTSISVDDLAAMPVKDGFRQRGMDMNRIETFTDAAFAFAVTLLVIGGGDQIPGNFEEMILAMKQVPAFAASFSNIMLFWYAHHIWSRRFGLEDTLSVLISLMLIFIALIFVYPLKTIYSGAFDFFSGGYLDSMFTMTSFGDLRNMFVIFGTGYAALSMVIVLLNRHALAKKDDLALNTLEQFDTQTEIGHWLINAIVPIMSIALALVLPGPYVAAAGIFYFILGILIPWHGVKRDRRRATI